jgi:hypothetical protein
LQCGVVTNWVNTTTGFCNFVCRTETCSHLMIQGCQMVYFQTKIPIWVNFSGSCKGRCWYILRTFGIFCDSLLYLFFLVCCHELSGNPDLINGSIH